LSKSRLIFAQKRDGGDGPSGQLAGRPQAPHPGGDRQSQRGRDEHDDLPLTVPQRQGEHDDQPLTVPQRQCEHHDLYLSRFPNVKLSMMT